MRKQQKGVPFVETPFFILDRSRVYRIPRFDQYCGFCAMIGFCWISVSGIGHRNR
jgi:hypothetical protein